jgi:hypothetical protein
MMEMVRNLCRDGLQRDHLVRDLKLLTNADQKELDASVDFLCKLYRRMPFSMLEQISEGEFLRILTEMNSGFSPEEAAVGLWGIEIRLTDLETPYEQLAWGLEWLQKSDYLPDVPKDTVLTTDLGGDCLLIREIEKLADRFLITSSGGHHTGLIAWLADHPGVDHVVLESDSFGPLRCGLKTSKGTLCYG